MTIPALARELGMPRRTLFRQLTQLLADDERTRPQYAGWMFRGHGPWRVNRSRLRRSHPEQFGQLTPEEADDRLSALEEHERETRKRVNALSAAFREHAKGHAPPSPPASSSNASERAAVGQRGPSEPAS